MGCCYSVSINEVCPECKKSGEWPFFIDGHCIMCSWQYKELNLLEW